MRSIGASTLRNDGRKNIGTQAYEKTAAIEVPYRDICGKCGARRIDNQIGLEETPDCGLHGQLRIKKDLTPEQLRYVLQRLLDAGLLYGRSYGTNDTK